MNESVDHSASRASRSNVLITALAYFALFTAIAALPWEVYQRTPFGFTLTRASAVGVMVLAVIHWSVFDRGLRFSSRLTFPIALFLAMGALTCLYSLDRVESFDRLKLYGLYAVLFFAVAYWVADAERARHLLIVYVGSTAAVAVVTLLCFAEWLWPVSWKPSSWAIQRLIVEFRDGVPMRMAATSLDLNLPAMLFASSFGAALFLFGHDLRSVWRSCGLGAILMVFTAAIFVSMSRSGLLIIALFFFVFLFNVNTMRIRLLLAGTVIALGGVLLVMTDTSVAKVLFARTNVNSAGDAASMHGRVEVYGIAIRSLPRYGVVGAGLANSEKALAQLSQTNESEMVIHNVPLLLWIELGIVGLVAYGWLWYAMYRTVRPRDVLPSRIEETHTGNAMLAVGTTVFLMTLSQPFVAQIHYPLLAGVACGPAIDRVRRSSGLMSERLPFTAALLLVSVTVVGNVLVYQHTVSRVLDYNDAMSHGHTAEQNAQWGDAAVSYANAAIFAEHGPFFSALPMVDVPHVAVAEDLVDIARLHQSMGIAGTTSDDIAAANYAQGRVLLLAGITDPAETAYRDAWSRDASFSIAQFGLAEVRWRQGRFADAIQLYAEAPHSDEVPGVMNAYRLHREELVARAEALRTLEDIPSRLERARLLRKIGDWGAALPIYESVLIENPSEPEALFHLGVAAEIGGDSNLAKEYYTRTVTEMPGHFDATKRLEFWRQ